MNQDNRIKKAKMIRRLREEAGLTQKQLAATCEMSINTLRSYENGNRELGKAEGYVLLKLSRELGCTVESLIE